MTLATNPPWWVLFGLVLTTVVVAYGAYGRPPVPLSVRQRGFLMGLRLVALLAILLALLRPVSVRPSAATTPVVPVLLDSSRSMAIADMSGRRRVDVMGDLVATAIVQLVEADYQVELLAFGEDVRATGLDALAPSDTRSDFATALRHLEDRYQDREVAGVVLLSDGADTSGEDVGSWSPGFPLHTIGVGATRRSADVEVTSLVAGEAAVRESVIDVEATVVAYGRGPGPVEVRLEEDGRLLDVRQVVLAGDDVPTRVQFQVSPHAERATVYSVEVPGYDGEAVVENNRRSVLVEPPGPPRRVLMVEGSPGYEHSFLKRVWLADPGVELDAVVRKGHNDVGEATFYIQAAAERSRALSSGFAEGSATLFGYDAVVLANLDVGSLEPELLDMTAAFVGTRGGGLLLLGSVSLTGDGLRGSALEPLLPLGVTDRRRANDVDPDDVGADRVQPTDDGLDHPILQLDSATTTTADAWRTLPRLSGSVRLGPAKPGASVLARVAAPDGERRPLIAVQRYGRGRSMVFAGEGAWRWQMLLSADDTRYERFWGQVIRWLTGGSRPPVTLDGALGRMPGERVELDLSVRDAEHRPVSDAPHEIRIVGPGGETETIQAELVDAPAGRYVAHFVAARPGVYRVDATVRGGDRGPATATDWVLVGGSDPEWADPRRNGRLLDRLSESTGGRGLTTDQLSELPGLLQSNRPPAGPPVTRELWHGAWSFFLVVVVLSTEWTLRRAWGMR